MKHPNRTYRDVGLTKVKRTRRNKSKYKIPDYLKSEAIRYKVGEKT